MGIVTVVLPVFVLILLGWLFKAWNLIRQEAGKHYMTFIRKVAAPALLLLSLASSNFASIWHWDFILSLGLPVSIFFIVSTYVMHVVLRKGTVHSAIGALAVSSSNVVYIGLPLLYGVFGRGAIVPAALAILIQMILRGLAVFYLEATSKGGIVNSFKRALCIAVCNPFTIAIILGVLYSLTNFIIPSGIAKFLHLLEIAIVPVALFGLGLQIETKEFAKRFQSSFILWALKLVILPAIVLWVVAAFDVSALWACSAVIIAGLPYLPTVSHIGPHYSKEGSGGFSHLWGGSKETVTTLSIVSMFIWFIILSHVYSGEFSSILATF